MTLASKTLSRPTEAIRGVGVRSGLEITVRLIPAEAGAGLTVHRTDIGARVPLDLRHALELPNCTAVGTCAEDAVMFVEHLMAALHVHGVTDLVVEVDGPELPLLDGSARAWDGLLREAGVEDLGGEVQPIVVTQAVRIEDGEACLVAEPGPPTVFAYELEYAHPLIGRQEARFAPGRDEFAADLAPARTFALIEDLRQAQAAGLVRGGGEENCRIAYAERWSAAPTLPDECARHKILDMLGDLYLLGRPVWGRIKGRRSGHAHNRALLLKLGAE